MQELVNDAEQAIYVSGEMENSQVHVEGNIRIVTSVFPLLVLKNASVRFVDRNLRMILPVLD
jgi:hypothetical protein